MKSKYHNRITEVDGIKFASKAEAERYRELKLLEASGEIQDLVLQPPYILQERFRYRGRWERPIIYRGDFAYTENGKPIVEDVKGVMTDVFRLKHKLFCAKYPHIEFRIVKHEKGGFKYSPPQGE